MKVLLMHPDRDFNPKPARRPHEEELIQDLALDTLLAAMSNGDAFLLSIARAALLSGVDNDLPTIRHRQEVMRDCTAQAPVVRELYALAVEAIERSRHAYFGYRARSPRTNLYGSVDLLATCTDVLRRVRKVGDEHAAQFASLGFRALFATLQEELGDDYLTSVEQHLVQLRFRQGVFMSARLGPRNEGTDYVLRLPRDQRPHWIQMILGETPRGYVVRIDNRDEAGARALSELRDRGIDRVANAVAQAAEHVLGFFQALRAELAFYVASLNLYDRLVGVDAPICCPEPEPAGARRLQASGLYDVCLTLRVGERVIANSVDADGKHLVIITGANQGGKSSFLRSLGVAQLMTEAGMFVGAESFTVERCRGVFTHYKREEDASMTMGKLDEELARLSSLVDALGPDTLLLLNESFAATNEREGSEIARQVVTTLVANGVKILFVTHLFAFAHQLATQQRSDTLLLRAERLPDGTRTFHVCPGEPLETSYGPDLYRDIFGAEGHAP